MSIKSVAIQRYSKSIFDVVGINKNFIKIKEPDGSITSVRRDDDDFTVLLNVTESEINRFIGCIRPRIMPKEVFERPPKTWNMTYEEYKQCYVRIVKEQNAIFMVKEQLERVYLK